LGTLYERGFELDGFFSSPEDAPPKWLFVIRAYLDETGQSEQDYVIIAGHAGCVENWGQFVDLWKQSLGPQRLRLHMHDLRWSKDSTRKLLLRSGVVPSKCELLRVIGGAKVSDYADLIKGTPGKILFDGYMNALNITVLSLLLAIPKDERVEIVFEQQDRYAKIAHEVLDIIASMKHPRLQTSDGITKLARWSFVPKQSTILFDQADYLCYSLLQKSRDVQSKKAVWCSPILEGGQEPIGEILNREQVRTVIKKHNQDLGWLLPKSGKIWQ
jgi:hypothetical protein